MFKKKLGFLLCVMLVLSIAGYIICSMAGSKQIKEEDDFLLVTSFYPMYVLAQNLTAGIEDVTVENLTENQTGCLHDYQLTSKDMKLLSKADAFLIHGAGMELFLDKVMAQYEDLPLIEASEGMILLEGIVHEHTGEEFVDDSEHIAAADDIYIEENHVHTEEEEHGHDHDHSENGHVWMDVKRYREEVVTVTKGLLEVLPEQKTALEKAAALYDAELLKLQNDCERLREVTEGVYVVIFHEAFAYLAESLGMDVLMALSLDEETTPSAGEIAEIIEEIKYHGTALLLIEEQYASSAEKIAAETNAKIVYTDPLTTGDGAADSYIKGMQKNLEQIRNTFY